MRIVLLIALLSTGMALHAQDLTGTWKGELLRETSFSGGPRSYRMTWELVQVEREVYGIVYFFPQDTRDDDKPNVWYTWYGKEGKTNSFPFTFIKGRYIDGPGEMSVYQFNVEYHPSDSMDILSGKWFNQLETLNTMEKPNGIFKIRRVSNRVSDKLWLKRKEKEILEKVGG